jgi:hypothetical protein
MVIGLPHLAGEDSVCRVARRTQHFRLGPYTKNKKMDIIFVTIVKIFLPTNLIQTLQVCLADNFLG